jgi:class 3 adenylate cyclase
VSSTPDTSRRGWGSFLKTPQSGIERVLFEAAWENEKVINYFRIVFCLMMGVPSVVSMIIIDGNPFGPAWSLIVWAACGVALIPILRRSFHRALSFVLSTADATIWMLGLYLFYLNAKNGQVTLHSHNDARAILGGMVVNAMFVVGINAARFSASVAVWSTLYAFALYVFLVSGEIGFTPSFMFEGIVFVAFAGLLVMTSLRLRKVLVRVRERDAFARFLPAPAVERLARDPSQLNLGGENQEATVLFSDIRGFTTLSAAMRPDEVVAMLNEYFTEMVNELFAWEGTLDKFIGDGLVAVFAPPLSHQDQATRAIRCALGMVARLEKLNERRVARGEPALKIGIGLHSGPLVAGSIGSPVRMEYTHIGDTMNTCSRIEGATKELAEAVLASESTIQRAGSSGLFVARPMPKTALRGKADALQLYAIDAPAAAGAPVQAIAG